MNKHTIRAFSGDVRAAAFQYLDRRLQIRYFHRQHIQALASFFDDARNWRRTSGRRKQFNERAIL